MNTDAPQSAEDEAPPSSVPERKQASKRRLVLPIAAQTRFVLARPHYPENVGAAARAMKTMGFSKLSLVRPGKLAQLDHPMTRKMAVKSWDVLDEAEQVLELEQALSGVDFVMGTTAQAGQTGLLTLEQAAEQLQARASKGLSCAVLFGNEKSGLSDAELGLCHAFTRIPMAAAQPSINLAQACQLVAYQLFVTGLKHREAENQRKASAE